MLLEKFSKLLFFGYFILITISSGASIADELQKYKLRFYADGSFYVTPLVPNVLFQIGKIERDQYSEFRRAIVNHKVSTIVLDSPGGNVYESLDMAGTIFDRRLSTYVPEHADCFSACAFMFFAGRERYSSGKLGVHQTSYDDEIGNQKAKIGEVDSAAQLSTADIIQYLNEFGTPPNVYEWMLRTPPNEMHIFSKQELSSLEINSAFSKSQRVQIESFRADLLKSMQIVSCNEDAETCTDIQICNRAASSSKWLSNVEAKPYINEANKRSLTCGVPIATCATDINVCKTNELCDLAVVLNNGVREWSDRDDVKSYVSLAKSRNLTCGVLPKVVCSTASPATCSISELCQRATIRNNDKRVWRSGSQAQRYVTEAQTRGLTCGVKTRNELRIATCSEVPKMCNDVELCRRATTVFNYKLSWSSNSDTKPFVNEAKRNLLDCIQLRNPSGAVKYWTRKVQESLNSVGCNVGKVDGIAGRKTKFALSNAAKQLSMPYSNLHLNDQIYLKEMNNRIVTAGYMKNCTLGSRSVSKPSNSVAKEQVSKLPSKPTQNKKEPDPIDGVMCAADIGLTAATGGWWLLFGGSSCF